MKRSPLIILFLTLFIDLLGFGLIIPLLPVYIERYGGSPWIGGFLMASFSAMQFLFSPIWGRLSDIYGRRPFILISMFGSAVTYFFFGNAPNLFVLFLARIGGGILTAASLPTAQAYIADVTTPEKRAGGMAMMGAAFGLGFAFGPAISGVLSQYSVFGQPAIATPALFAALLALINFVLAFFLLPESHTERGAAKDAERKGVLEVFPDIWKAMRHPAIGTVLTVFAFATFAFTAVESTFSWLVILRFREAIQQMAEQSWLLTNPGLNWLTASAPMKQEFIAKAQAAASTRIFIIVGITILITQVAVMGGLSRKLGEITLMRIGALMLTVTIFALALAPSLGMVAWLSVFIAMGNGLMSPTLSALVTQAAGPNERGMLSGAQQGLGSLARIIAPPINNGLVGMNTAIPFFASAALMAVAFVMSLRLRLESESVESHLLGDVRPTREGGE